MSTPPIIHDTGRRYYASTAEAFRDAEYACAIERCRRDPADRIVLWGCAVIGVVFAVLVVLRWLPGGGA